VVLTQGWELRFQNEENSCKPTCRDGELARCSEIEQAHALLNDYLEDERNAQIDYKLFEMRGQSGTKDSGDEEIFICD